MAGLDKQLAAGWRHEAFLRGVEQSSVILWTPRTPDGAAADLARIIRPYTSEWSVRRVILIGYSFGANLLPFLVNRLPRALLPHVRSVALLGPSKPADFEFHVSDWIRPWPSVAYQTVAEAERLTVPVLCVRGADEDDSACRSLRAFIHLARGRARASLQWGLCATRGRDSQHLPLSEQTNARQVVRYESGLSSCISSV